MSPNLHGLINNNGQIQLIVGPMFAGKTTELQRRYDMYNRTNSRCIFIKHVLDKRYSSCSSESVTHAKNVVKGCYASDTLEAMNTEASYADVVCIDEGQFFPDLVEYCNKWADAGKTVIVAGLNGTFKQEPFNQIAKLQPTVEVFNKLYAICIRCNNSQASFQLKLSLTHT